MKSLLTYSMILYSLLLVGLQLCIKKHNPTNTCTQSEIKSHAPGKVKKLLANSAVHDGRNVLLEGVVRVSGDPFFDLFLLPSYLLETNEGITIQVFTSLALPHTGQRVRVCGTFRQFSHNFYLRNWCGVYESKRGNLSSPDPNRSYKREANDLFPISP